MNILILGPEKYKMKTRIKDERDKVKELLLDHFLQDFGPEFFQSDQVAVLNRDDDRVDAERNAGPVLEPSTKSLKF